MTFVILGFDGPDGQTQTQGPSSGAPSQPRTSREAGRLIMAGPFTDQAGSLIILEANSLQEARRIAEEIDILFTESLKR